VVHRHFDTHHQELGNGAMAVHIVAVLERSCLLLSPAMGICNHKGAVVFIPLSSRRIGASGVASGNLILRQLDSCGRESARLFATDQPRIKGKIRKTLGKVFIDLVPPLS